MFGLRLFTTSLATFIAVHSSLVVSQPSSRNVIQFRSDSGSLKASPIGKPAFCNDIDCPEYKEVLKTEDYEIRDYAPSNWVSTHLEGVSYDKAIRSLFMKLFEYIDGNNDREEKIAMTAPVLNRVIPGPGPACKSNFTMFFYISPSLKDPPQPKDKTVFFTDLPAQRVYTRYFSGFATESDYLKNAEALGKALIRDSLNFDSSYFYTAGYDSPFKILFRHNEVWFIAK